MTKTTEKFTDWSEAFAVCRERNRPMLAQVGNEVAKIFPSGRFEIRQTAKPAKWLGLS